MIDLDHLYKSIVTGNAPRQAGRPAGLKSGTCGYLYRKTERHRGIRDNKGGMEFMNYHSDPTADRAIGNLTKEWNRLAKIADKIRQDPYSDWSQAQRRLFTGIFKRLLDDPAGSSGRKAS